jgi:IS4 transposase
LRTIHKKPLTRLGDTVLQLPSGAFITRVDLQDGRPHAWVATDDAAPIAQHAVVRIIGTGVEIPDGYWPVGTFLEEGGALVWHAVVKWETLNV